MKRVSITGVNMTNSDKILVVLVSLFLVALFIRVVW
jgi:hypothetical protein